MQKILVSLFDNPRAAFETLRDLAANGFGGESASMIANDTVLDRNPDMMMDMGEGVSGRGQTISVPGVGPVHVMGPMSTGMFGPTGAQLSDIPIVTSLSNEGVPMSDAHAFAEGVRRGGTLVMVTAVENEVPVAQEIMSRHQPIDIHRVTQDWRSAGWSGFDASARPLRYEELDWPHSITARPGEFQGEESEENWPQDIAARGGEKHETEEEATNWPENIVDPDRRTDAEEDSGSDWPHNITSRPDEE